MATNQSHHILHRMVPLICQALTTSPNDDVVWLEGLRLLCDPKLHTIMNLTPSIWLPLLLKGIDPARSPQIIAASLRALTEMAGTLEPMKSCLIKPLKALARHSDPVVATSEELIVTVEKLNLKITDNVKRIIGREMVGSQPSTPLPPTTPAPASVPNPRDHPLLAEILSRNLPAKSRTIRHAWTTTLLSTTHDNPAVWLNNLFHSTLEASAVPEMVITARLGNLVQAELFQTAFLKCYLQIANDKQFKESVDSALVRLLCDTSMAKDISSVLLDLVAFFSKEGAALPQAVLDAAKRCALGNFRGDLHQPVPAIVLWYAEQQTAEDMSAENIANLVEVNIRIGASGYDSAWSSLLWLQDDFEVYPNPMWLTQLSHWDTALTRQDYLDEGQPGSTFASFNTRMICHHAMGQFEKGYNLCQSLYEGLNDHERRKTAHWATAAAWHMADFETMADYLAFHPKGTSKSLYKAIIDVHHGQYASAFHHIAKGQSLSYDELQAQLRVGPQVALKTLAKTEVLVELQEVIQYKFQPESREHILGLWKARFKRSHADANSWLKRLQVWHLACPTTEIRLQSCYLDCAKLCESSGMHEAAARILDWVTPDDHPPGCKVEYTRMRFEWKTAAAKQDTSKMREVLDRLHIHLTTFLDSLGVDRLSLEMEGLGLRPLMSTAALPAEKRTILARRFYRLAQWSEILQGSYWLTDMDSEVFRYYSLTYKLDDLWYNGAYSVAQAAMNVFEANGCQRSDPIAINSYVVPAVRGLFQAVRSRETPEKMIKALLRLVTLWFRYGESESVLVEVRQQLNETAVSSWLEAIPQLIARLGTRHKDLQGLLISLLKNIASQYPHAVIWPLLTASQTKKAEHEEAARVIMDYICTMPDGTKLVSQAELVGRELIRTSISWLEKWKSIVDKCLPRQDLMEIAWQDIPMMWEEEIDKLSNPETPDEEQFVQQFGGQLIQIFKTLVKYRATRQLNLVNSAYTDLYKLYGDMDSMLNHWKVPGSKLQLASAAPRLLSLRDCLLTVPGQYDHHIKLDNQAFIDSFHPTVDIVSSKQLPRKLVIRSYNSDFTFLLKGNEDLRGDERIMQLFTLINTLLNHESEAFGRNLHLLPYQVIPLSPSAGLLSWVKNTQPLQAMIQANRERDKSHPRLSNMERASILGYDPATFDPDHGKPRLDPQAEMDKYDKLPLEAKVERLKGALSHSKQSDLKDVLWQRSPSAEIWIRRRTNFARTIGVGSFVGHVIGLGDRHLSNILVDQLTWGALHIDFGDLFGAAQDRSYLPEKVPFRLTRMITNAFELAGSQGHAVPGTRGSFKQASIVTMGVLRESRSSLLAMLEAFLYDPLLSWTASTAPSSAANVEGVTASDMSQSQTLVNLPKKHQIATAGVMISHSVAPIKSDIGDDSSKDFYDKIDNSLIGTYLDADSYMAKATGGRMTNTKALQVLSQIEKKLAGFKDDSEQPLSVKKQVQELIEEAIDLRNLAQGYVLGWIPFW